MSTRPAAKVRRAEIVAALSLASDLTMGQPAESALRSCVLGMRLASLLGMGSEERTEVYFHSLLRYIGCNAESQATAAIIGDDISLRRDAAAADMGKPSEVLALTIRKLREANAGAAPPAVLWAVASGLVAIMKAQPEAIAAHCEVAERLAERLSLSAAVRRNLGQIYERWDGKGLPGSLKGEAISPAVRVVTFVQDAVLLRRLEGQEAAFAKLKARSGSIYEPLIVDRFMKRADELLAGLDEVSSWDVVLALEPEPHVMLSDAEFDTACMAMADFVDIKSPHTAGHSRAVSALAGEAAKRCNLPAADVTDIRRAGLLHDIGQAGISGHIWAKTGPLSDGEWEQVRLHAYYGERVLSRAPELARLGAIVAQHHERCDGSGYHARLRASAMTPQGRILAAAEAYQGMIETRAHRPALSADAAANQLKRMAREGALDGEAVSAVLASAGHKVQARQQIAGGLTAREIEVLRLVARGQTAKEIGRSLGISPKTADNHIQNLYAKIGVKTRAGATLYAVEHGLNES